MKENEQDNTIVSMKIRKVARQRLKVKAISVKSDTHPNGISMLDYLDQFSKQELK